MIRFVFRLVFRAFMLLVLAGIALVGYYLYSSGQLPGVKRAVEETALSGSVTAAFKLHRDLSLRSIDVETEDGEVTLAGAVASEAERDEAAEIAGQIEGVDAVVNQLVVEPDLAATHAAEPSKSLGERIDDAALLTKVRAALHLDKATRDVDLDISVSSGNVVVRGEVPTEDLADRVRRKVSSVSGVDSLDDQLELPPP